MRNILQHTSPINPSASTTNEPALQHHHHHHNNNPFYHAESADFHGQNLEQQQQSIIFQNQMNPLTIPLHIATATISSYYEPDNILNFEPVPTPLKNYNLIQDSILSDLKKNNHHNDKLILNDQCSICLENFNDCDNVSILPCNHVYHKNCIYRWFNNNNQCPLCKTNLDEIENEKYEEEEYEYENDDEKDEEEDDDEKEEEEEEDDEKEEEEEDDDEKEEEYENDDEKEENLDW